MADEKVRILKADDGTWSAYVRHIEVRKGITRAEAERIAEGTPEDAVKGTRWESQWRNRNVARERITGGVLRADDE